MKTKRNFCPNCETDRAFRLKNVERTIKVHSECIALSNVPAWECPVCRESHVDESFGDPVAAAFDEYRRRHELLTPARIKSIRQKRGLSQAGFAALLGMSQATINRYEAGALQEQTHDEPIRACGNDRVFKDIVARRRRALSPSQLEKVRSVARRISRKIKVGRRMG